MTGVGYRDSELKVDEVPVNPDITFHHGRNKGRNKKLYLECKCQLLSPCDSRANWHGLYVHSTCWDVARRVVGPPALGQLDIFVEAMRQVWKTSFPYQPYALKEIIDSGSVGAFYWIGDSLEFILSGFTDVPDADEAYAQNDWFLPITTVSTPLRDPFRVPEVQTLIERCKNRKDVCRKPNSELPATKGRQKRGKKTFGHRSCLKNAPMDVVLMVLDELSASPLDAANAVEAFQWHFPDEIWKRKLPLDMMVELDGMSMNGFDWRCFFIEFSRLLESSEAMASRKRIFAVVNAIHDEFLNKLQNKQAPVRKLVNRN